MKTIKITAYQKYEQGIKTKATRLVYDKYLNDFFKYSGSNSEDFVKINQNKINDIVFDYIVGLKLRAERDEISPNSFNMFLAPVRLFLSQNDILLNWDKLKKMYPRKKQTVNQLGYNNEEIEKMLNGTSSSRIKAFIHFLSSTGCRVGAIHTAKVSNIEKIENGAIVTLYNDDIEEYRSCLTPEAYNALMEYFEYRNTQGYPVTKDSSIFCDKSNKKGISNSNAKNLLNHLLIKCGLRIKNQKRTKNSKSQNHAFRKRFDTEMVNAGVHSKYVEYMMCHFENKNDKHYFKPTNEDLWNNFKFGISRLTILDENKHLEKISELEIKSRNNESLEHEFSNLQREFFRLRQENEKNKKIDTETKKVVKRLIDEGLIDKLKGL